MIVARARVRDTEPGLQAFSGAFLYVSTASTTLVGVFTRGRQKDFLCPRRVEQLHDPPPARGADVRVDLRGRDRLVTQQIANVPDVGDAPEELGLAVVCRPDTQNCAKAPPRSGDLTLDRQRPN